jgi:exodeoxyribonuclease VII small subunit
MNLPTSDSSLPSYEQSLLELEQILRKLEDGDTTLDESLAQYERGMQLILHCHGKLQETELRIRQLSGFDDQGQPRTTNFEHSATTESVKSNRSDRNLKRD